MITVLFTDGRQIAIEADSAFYNVSHLDLLRKMHGADCAEQVVASFRTEQIKGYVVGGCQNGVVSA